MNSRLKALIRRTQWALKIREKPEWIMAVNIWSANLEGVGVIEGKFVLGETVKGTSSGAVGEIISVEYDLNGGKLTIKNKQ